MKNLLGKTYDKMTISAHRSGYTDQQNKEATYRLLRYLAIMGEYNTEILGSWKRVKETSFEIAYNEHIIEDIFQEFKQEAVLLTTFDGLGFLKFNGENETEFIGKKTRMTRIEAEKQDAYSFNTIEECYYSFTK